jgi:hypothetical protein
MLGSFDEVWGDPARCCQVLVSTGAVTHMSVVVVARAPRLRTLEVTCVPPPIFEGYPVEVARVTVFAEGSVVAVSVGPTDRTWVHRYPPMSFDALLTHLGAGTRVQWLNVAGALCLEYPGDPEMFRWNWSKGFDTYLKMVQRHLLAEEFARRYGKWPVEDAPHGLRPDGKPHPRTTPMAWAA